MMRILEVTISTIFADKFHNNVPIILKPACH